VRARERQKRDTPRATSRDVRREREKRICARFLCFEGVAEAGSLIRCPSQILESFSAPLLVKNYSFDVQFWCPPPHNQNPVPLLLLLPLVRALMAGSRRSLGNLQTPTKGVNNKDSNNESKNPSASGGDSLGAVRCSVVSVEEKESGSGAVLWMSEEAMLSASVSTGNLVAVRPLIRSLFVCILPPLEDSFLLSSRVLERFFFVACWIPGRQ